MLGLLAFQGAAPPLDRMAAAVRSHRSVSGFLRYTALGGSGELSFRVLAPDSVRLEGGPYGGLYLTDGREAWEISPRFRRYRRVPPREVYAQAIVLLGYNTMLRPLGIDFRAIMERDGSATSSGERWMGRDAIGAHLGLRYLYVPRQNSPGQAILVIDPETWLPLGYHSERPQSGPDGETYRYEDVVLDPPLKLGDFHFVPPPGYRDEATIPRSVAPPTPPLGTPYPRIEAKPGEWAERNGFGLRVEPRMRAYAGMWVFDLQTRGLDEADLRRSTALARVGSEWRFATLSSRDGGRRAIVTVPQDAMRMPPRAIQVRLAAGRGPETAFVFEWSP